MAYIVLSLRSCYSWKHRMFTTQAGKLIGRLFGEIESRIYISVHLYYFSCKLKLSLYLWGGGGWLSL